MSYFVTELYVYPIKNLAGIAVQDAIVQEMGFENDRRWMLIDAENQCITQRVYPILSQFYPIINGDAIEISYKGSKHKFLISETLTTPVYSQVWEDETKVYEVNLETSQWFSTQLGMECKLVKILNKGDRKHSSSQLNQTFNVSLSDGYPYLLIGSKSLDFLNEKLDEKISIQRFRPNIVIKSLIPHEEDSFDTFSIGDIQFKNAKTCVRCVMVNNNPTDGSVNKEPLRTLSTYRAVDNGVLFGTNIMGLTEGSIAVGDVLSF